MVRSPPSVAGLLALAACGAADDPAPAPTVRDSAGITLVESVRSDLSDDCAWRIEPDPERIIGVENGPPELQFDGIMGVVLLRDGRIAVGDMGTGEVRFYDADGKHLGSVGRPGQGPGEFGQILGMRPLPGDTLLVEDQPAHVELIAPDGRWLRDVRLPPQATLHAVVHLMPDGALIVRDNPQPRRDGGEQELRSTLYALIPGDSVLRPIARMSPVRLAAGYQGYPDPVVFGALPLAEVVDDRIILGSSDAWVFDVYGLDGTLRARFRRAWKPQPVTEVHRVAYRDAFASAPGEGGATPRAENPRRRALADAATFATQLPVFDRALLDRDGNLWVQHFDVRTKTSHGVPGRNGFNAVWPWPRTWSVFDREGRWVTDVATPPMFHALDIDAGRIAGIRRDEMGVDRVAVHRLRKPSP